MDSFQTWRFLTFFAISPFASIQWESRWTKLQVLCARPADALAVAGFFFIAAGAGFALGLGNMSQTTSETIVIRAEPIELSQLLKFAGIFGSGGEAKFAINSGEVTVNGTVELQARKKILGGQTVVIAGRTLLVKLGAAQAAKREVAPKPVAKTSTKPAAHAPVKGVVRPFVTGAAKAPMEKPRGFAKPPGGARPAKKTPAYRERSDDGYEDEQPKEKPALSAAGQRTFFYTELLKAQQSKRKKR